MVKNLITITGGILIAALMMFFVWQSHIKRKELKTNGVLLNGKIIDVKIPFVSEQQFLCEFIYNGRKIIRPSSFSVKEPTYFIGQQFPLMYAPNINKIDILMTPEDFAQYGFAFPDSLSWVLPYKIAWKSNVTDHDIP